MSSLNNSESVKITFKASSHSFLLIKLLKFEFEPTLSPGLIYCELKILPGSSSPSLGSYHLDVKPLERKKDLLVNHPIQKQRSASA